MASPLSPKSWPQLFSDLQVLDLWRFLRCLMLQHRLRSFVSDGLNVVLLLGEHLSDNRAHFRMIERHCLAYLCFA